ncbi:hypothetical protein [Humibacter ginsenosidimutans]|uniref:Uncharacterized protein n=1 Tax=Humibacter ginsenosidimutans TaxID=2599293 RepID=A0A5B8M4A6_9MICO|nr:hypothetical protein [Humibacter ginsenosidimutans]QDZ15153.1 hypothetical protein FPZ11_10565 [Humibacter ginsenosidimutans]
MKRINIAGTSIVTGSDLADALLALWTSVARLHRIEPATIPFVDTDGTRQTADVVLCSAVPIWTSTVESDGFELTDSAALAEIEARNASFDPLWGLSAVERDDE